MSATERWRLRQDLSPENIRTFTWKTVEYVRTLVLEPTTTLDECFAALMKSIDALFERVPDGPVGPGEEKKSAELAGPATATGGIPAPKETEHRTPQGTQGTEPATTSTEESLRIEIRAENDRLRAEVASLQADKERMDWLDGQGWSARQSIDAARAAFQSSLRGKQ